MANIPPPVTCSRCSEPYSSFSHRCGAAKEEAEARRSAAACSADVVDQLKRLADDWFARAVDEMNGAVKEKNARDGMNFYRHTARAAVLSDCRKQLMEIILPND